MKNLKLNGYKPGYLASREPKFAKGSSFDDDPAIIEVNCWSCNRMFKIAVNYSNLHVSVWRCPYCEEHNEIE